MLLDQAVEDHRPVIFDHLHDRIVQVFGIANHNALGAESFGEFHEIGQRLRPGVAVAFAMQQFLPLAHHAQALVVENELLHRQAVLYSSSHLLHVHQPGGFAGNVDHQRVRMCHLRADRGWEAITHGAEAAGGHKPVWILKAQILRRPHLVLADLGGDIAITALCQFFQTLKGVTAA